jgi:hypothetical protein
VAATGDVVIPASRVLLHITDGMVTDVYKFIAYVLIPILAIIFFYLSHEIRKLTKDKLFFEKSINLALIRIEEVEAKNALQANKIALINRYELENQNIKEATLETNATEKIQTSKWPWGNHHTETLGHLEAAAQQWWKLYDPGDITSAPTNEMVSSWLHEKRGVSKERARAIASMLRPDGLPTGPRR